MNRILKITATAISVPVVGLLVIENTASYRAMLIGLRKYDGDRESAETFTMCDDQTLPEYWLTWPGKKTAEIVYGFGKQSKR